MLMAFRPSVTRRFFGVWEKVSTALINRLKRKLENKTREFLDLSFLIRGQSGWRQGALRDKVTAVPHSPNCHEFARPADA